MEKGEDADGRDARNGGDDDDERKVKVEHGSSMGKCPRGLSRELGERVNSDDATGTR
jgi:hypothetical protein